VSGHDSRTYFILLVEKFTFFTSTDFTQNPFFEYAAIFIGKLAALAVEFEFRFFKARNPLLPFHTSAFQFFASAWLLREFPSWEYYALIHSAD
jgi:hypothetical protein